MLFFKKSLTFIKSFIFSFNQINNFENLYPKNRVINIAPEHGFDVTLANFEQKITSVIFHFFWAKRCL